MRLTPRNIITSVILCDSIREEISGKHTLVGVYTGDIVSSDHQKANINFSVYMEVRYPEGAAYKMAIRIRIGSKDVANAKLDLPAATGQDGTGVVNIASVRVSTTKDVPVVIDASLNDGKYVNVLKKFIKLTPPPSGIADPSIEIEQPS